MVKKVEVKEVKEEKVVKTDYHDAKDVSNVKLADTHTGDGKVGDSHK